MYAQLRSARAARKRSHQKGGGRAPVSEPPPDPTARWPERRRRGVPSRQQIQRRLDVAEVAELVARYENRESLRSLARRFQIRIETVRSQLVRAGVEIRVYRRFSETVLAEVLALQADGWSVARLAGRYEVTGQTVREWLGRSRAGSDNTTEVPESGRR